jgi:uncharacterized membrane protein YidH (DUF202 family)
VPQVEQLQLLGVTPYIPLHHQEHLQQAKQVQLSIWLLLAVVEVVLQLVVVVEQVVIEQPQDSLLLKELIP